MSDANLNKLKNATATAENKCANKKLEETTTRKKNIETNSRKTNRFVEFVCVIRRIFERSCIEIDSSKKALPLVVINLVSCNAGSMNTATATSYDVACVCARSLVFHFGWLWMSECVCERVSFVTKRHDHRFNRTARQTNSR